MRWVITITTLILAASAAAACVNDREVDAHEREFKSHYLAPRPQESAPSSEPSNLPLVAAGGGVLLLVAAGVVAGRSA